MFSHSHFFEDSFLNRCRDAVNEIPFWSEGENGVYEFEDNHRNVYLQETLPSLGFFNYFEDGNITAIQIHDNIVRKVTVEDVRVFVSRVLGGLPSGRKILSEISKHLGWFFDKSVFIALPCLDKKPIADTRTDAFVPYRNGLIYIRNRGSEVGFTEYRDLQDSFVWASQIRSRCFKMELLKDFSEDALIAQHPADEIHKFLQWCQNLCMRQSEEGGDYNIYDEKRFQSLISALGYLQHQHWNEYKCVVFVDEHSVPGEANGRTGKSLVLNDALKHCLETVYVDGKKLANKQVDKFTFHSVEQSTQYIIFDDISSEFDFSNLFSIITGPLDAQKKYGGIQTFSKEMKPKMAITTNHPIKGNGASFEDRQHIVEIGGFYRQMKFDLDMEPHVYHGAHLFEQDWNDADWEQFDFVCIGSLMFYMKNGLVGGGMTENYRLNKLSQEVGCKKLVNITKQFLERNVDKEVYSHSVDGMTDDECQRCLRDYVEENYDYGKLSPNKITRTLKAVAKHFGYGVNNGDTKRIQKRFGEKRYGVSVLNITTAQSKAS